MVFSSIAFLCVFLPVVLILYYLMPWKMGRNGLLLIASLLFYAYGEPTHIVLLIACTFWNWLIVLCMEKWKKFRKFFFLLAFLLDICFLGIFKYASMAISTINGVFGLSLADPEIALPIGISFFTFQAMSYVADVYRGQVKKESNFLKVLLYISFFPQLIAGPIVRYRDIAAQIDEREVSVLLAAQGMKRFVYGLAKKVLISNYVAVLADAVFSLSAQELSMPAAWAGALAYTLQIYFDFSGYSDMAIGLGQMFGFRFLENFDHPYIAGSMLDFWKRWHISLTNWFRENLYFPLGGNRKGKKRTWLNRFIVFFCTGLWHGASWTFVLWGLWHGALTSLETAFPNMTKKMGGFRHVYVLLMVMVGFVLFRADTLSQALQMFSFMFVPTAMTAQRLTAFRECMDLLSVTALLAGALCSFPPKMLLQLPGKLVGNKQEMTEYPAVLRTVSYMLTPVLLLLCMFSLAGGSYNPFIYFRF